jgi:hypothetical protein
MSSIWPFDAEITASNSTVMTQHNRVALWPGHANSNRDIPDENSVSAHDVMARNVKAMG